MNQKIIAPLEILQATIFQSQNITGLYIHDESKEYGACRFQLDNKIVEFRVAKTTPTKIGQFVTMWKRNSKKNNIEPYDLSDTIDLFIIYVNSENNQGVFIFPKLVLFEQGFISKNDDGGKRAMRVYPAWDKPENKQACNTQEWQLRYFTKI